MIQPIMLDHLQQIDLDYYRSAQLLIVHAELEQLRQERSASADVERRSSPGVDNVSGDVGIISSRHVVT